MASKFQNIRCEGFDSKLEHAVYQLLVLRERAGELKIIRTQENIFLTDARILYIPDFSCQYPSGENFWVEAKGFEGPRWPTIKKLWKFYGPGVLEIWQGKYARPFLTETIVPRVKVAG